MLRTLQAMALTMRAVAGHAARAAGVLLVVIAAVAAGIGISAMAASLVPAQLTRLGAGHRLPELGPIDLILLTNPRADQRLSVRALTRTVLSSGSRSLSAYRDETGYREETGAQ